MAGISLSKVHKRYGATVAVAGVDLEIRSGEFLVILGPSGCGKSSLLRMIAGLEDISDGTIAIDGEIVNAVAPGERGCAMVFQSYALYPHMTVAENIGYALKVAGVPKQARAERVGAIAGMLGLQDLLDRKPGQLSGGQRQRVAMGRAMIRSPKVFLFDEPLSNLDAKLRLQMRLEIKRLHRDLRTTSVFVTHDQIEAMTLADRLVVMSAGRIEQAGTPTEIYARPASLFVADFIGSPPMNLMPARIDRDGRAVTREAPVCPELRFDLPAGSEVVVGARPAAVSFTAPAAPGALRFELEMVEDLGGELHFHGLSDGRRLTVSKAPGTVPPAAPLGVSFPPDALHLFRADDGRRVEASARIPFETAAEGVHR
ncbi:sn-glycerol 3-phosphate transport system ATP-binding protein [Amorphus suaedae]